MAQRPRGILALPIWQMISGRARRWALPLGAVTLALFWVLTLIIPYMSGRAGFFDPLEYRLLDVRHVLIGPRAAASDIVIVAIDDETLAAAPAELQSRRQLLARIISNIAQSDARVLALDVLLADPGPAEDDAALAAALGEIPSSIAAAARFGADSASADSIIWPQAAFGEVAEAGLVNLSTDASGTPRYAPLLIDAGGSLVPSLPLLASLSFGGEKAVFGETQLTLGTRDVPLDFGFNMPLRHIGPEGSVPTYSARDLISGTLPDALSDKLVVLGFSASAMGDRFATPFDENTPGMEVIATAISQLSGGETLRRDAQTRQWDAALAVALTLICVTSVLVWPLSRGVPVAAGFVLVFLASITLAFASGLWLSGALALAVALPPAIAASGLRYMQENLQARKSEQSVASLRQFQSPALAAKIESDPNYLMEPIEQDLVVLFVDLTGFTGHSQRLGQDGTRNLLAMFHKLTAQTVEARGGSVFNYMGDGALAVFGLERGGDASHADDALASAFDLVHSLSHQSLPQTPDEPLSCRIGLHSGPVTLSRLGAQSHQQVTVTGDNVNLASRLMEVAKTEKAVVVASSDFAAGLTDGGPQESAYTTDVAIRGRDGRVQVLVWAKDALERS
ncbi:putative cyclase [Roseobacter denitrificans OCh 114]|uniref:Putative cyclase n=2 Tax=Roseobacter denitrificans TaxID=2434 RepID=Q16CT5_ROSDO|nr:putative cyclase [Roseobacter denitrificans OCh 114]